MENRKKLLYKTRGNSSPNKKQKIYFTSHDEDFDIYFEEITREILLKHDVAIWYKNFSIQNEEDHLLDLSQMNLFVIPITYKLLTSSNYTLDVEYKFAIDRHIPVLLIMVEAGLVNLFNQRCGDIQYLDKTNKDITSISYDEKLKKYLDNIIIGDELTEKIKSEFDGHIFLSYRKKDRKYAQELMELIHSSENLRDIGIWYDEFLTLGEDFNEEIIDILKKSDLFTLVVTPHLLEEPNYVMEKEFPKAKEFNKKILPAEKKQTNVSKLEEKYKGIPPLVNGENLDALSKKIIESLETEVTKINDEDPEHMYLIGLAYLKGINVEVNNKIALSLILKAAENDYIEAIKKLIFMYHNGEGVERDYMKEIQWREDLVKKLECIYNETLVPQDGYNLFNELLKLAEAYKSIGQLNKAREVYLKTNEIAIQQDEKHCTKTTNMNVAIIFGYLGEIELELGNFEFAKVNFTCSVEILEKISENTPDEIFKDNLAIAYIKLGDFELKLGELDVAKQNYLKAMAIYVQLDRENDTIDIKRSLALCCINLGRIEQYLNELELAKNSYLKALDILSLIENDLDTIDSKRDLAVIYSNLGNIESMVNDFDKSRQYFLKSVDIIKSIIDVCDNLEAQINLSKNYTFLGIIEEGVMNFNQAKYYYEETQTILKNLIKETDSIEVLDDLAMNYLNLGRIEFVLENVNKAKENYYNSIDIKEKIVSQYPTIATLEGLAMAYYQCAILDDFNVDMELLNRACKIYDMLIEQYPDREHLKECRNIIKKSMDN